MKLVSVFLFIIPLFLAPSTGNCASQTDTRTSNAITKLKALKSENIELSSIVIEAGQIKIEGYARGARFLSNYLHTIDESGIGLAHVMEIMAENRDGRRDFHFILSVEPNEEKVDAASSAMFANAPNTPEESRSVWLNLNSKTAEWNYIKVSDDASKAFSGIYGGLKWNDGNLAKYFQGKTTGYVTPKFEEKFTEGGKEKLLVLGYITPEPIDNYFCHACVPLLGGAIFLKQGSGWVAESVNKIIGWGDPVETGRFGIILIGPKKYAVAMYIADAHQGYEDARVEILVPHDGKLEVALNTGYTEKPGDAACTNVPMSPQKVDVRFEPGKDSDYFDALVQLQFNEGTCEKFVRQDKTTRYRFHNGRYQPV